MATVKNTMVAIAIGLFHFRNLVNTYKIKKLKIQIGKVMSPKKKM